jgi:GntR family transcriptional regulator, transcriptional repressor for pyruvate dehydrogenase complex
MNTIEKKYPVRKFSAAGAKMGAALSLGTLSSQMVDRMRSALMSGAIRNGDFLGTEASLAGQFGVSRTVVREALRGLSAFGIVEVRAGRNGGIWVADGSTALLVNALAIQLKLIGITQHEMLEMQAAIEVQSSELAAQRRTDSDLARLRNIVLDLEILVEQPDAFTVRSLDFHQAVVESSHNRGLAAQFAALRLLLLPVYAAHTQATIAREAINAHRMLLAKIEQADSEGARKQMAQRLAQVRARGFSDTQGI